MIIVVDKWLHSLKIMPLQMVYSLFLYLVMKLYNLKRFDKYMFFYGWLKYVTQKSSHWRILILNIKFILLFEMIKFTFRMYILSRKPRNLFYYIFVYQKSRKERRKRRWNLRWKERKKERKKIKKGKIRDKNKC